MTRLLVASAAFLMIFCSDAIAARKPNLIWILADGDWMATAAELSGEQIPPGLDSISFLPTLLSQADRQKQHEFLYWEFHERGFSQAVLYQGRWKGIRERSPDAPLQLFDLRNDIGEEINVAAEHPEIAARLDDYLRTARSESADWPVKTPRAEKKRPAKS